LNKSCAANVERRTRQNIMKKLLLLTLALSLPLAQVMSAENDKDKKKHKRQADAAAENRGQQAAAPVRRAVAPTRHAVKRTPRSLAPTERTVTRAPRPVAPVRERQPVKSEANLNGQNRERTQAANQAHNRNQDVNRGRTNSQVAVQRNGGGNRNFDRNSFTVARSRVIRTRHNRGWWHSHFNTTFVLFGGGYYYWNGGYWYPAYGYDPYYSTYAYSEPIYGYNNLAPGQVLENVQLALRNQGYYRGAIDGLIGPQTRAALAAYQRDNGLVVTAAVDEPTLVTLGFA
jgi:hypothetical protein